METIKCYKGLFNLGDFAIFEMEEALIAGAAKAESEVAFCQDEGAVDEGVERAEEVPLGTAV